MDTCAAPELSERSIMGTEVKSAEYEGVTFYYEALGKRQDVERFEAIEKLFPSYKGGERACHTYGPEGSLRKVFADKETINYVCTRPKHESHFHVAHYVPHPCGMWGPGLPIKGREGEFDEFTCTTPEPEKKQESQMPKITSVAEARKLGKEAFSKGKSFSSCTLKDAVLMKAWESGFEEAAEAKRRHYDRKLKEARS